MELASLLASERFADRPRSVCPVIAAFLSAYNDLVDDARRQDLIPYAAEVVGTRDKRAVMSARAELCRRFVERFEQEPPTGFGLRLTNRSRAREIALRAGRAAALNPEPWAHSTALALADTLIACGRRAGTDLRPAPSTRSGTVGIRAGW